MKARHGQCAQCHLPIVRKGDKWEHADGVTRRHIVEPAQDNANAMPEAELLPEATEPAESELQPEQIAQVLGLRPSDVKRVWLGANPIEPGATDDGFCFYADACGLMPPGSGYDRKLDKTYTPQEIADLARVTLKGYVAAPPQAIQVPQGEAQLTATGYAEILKRIALALGLSATTQGDYVGPNPFEAPTTEKLANFTLYGAHNGKRAGTGYDVTLKRSYTAREISEFVGVQVPGLEKFQGHPGTLAERALDAAQAQTIKLNIHDKAREVENAPLQRNLAREVMQRVLGVEIEDAQITPERGEADEDTGPVPTIAYDGLTFRAGFFSPTCSLQLARPCTNESSDPFADGENCSGVAWVSIPDLAALGFALGNSELGFFCDDCAELMEPPQALPSMAELRSSAYKAVAEMRPEMQGHGMIALYTAELQAEAMFSLCARLGEFMAADCLAGEEDDEREQLTGADYNRAAEIIAARRANGEPDESEADKAMRSDLDRSLDSAQ